MIGESGLSLENKLKTGLEKRYGKYRGFVTRLDDPLKQGRIKAKIPSLLGAFDSNWALPCSPFAGDTHGLQLMPEIGDGVWIEFEEGNPNKPIWVGFWWKPDTTPTSLKDNYDTTRRYLWVPGNMYIEFDSSKKIINIIGAEADTTINIKTTSTANINADTVNVKAGTLATVDAPEVRIAGGGAAVARVGDSIIGVCPHGGVTGVISSGSSIANCGG